MENPTKLTPSATEDFFGFLRHRDPIKLPGVRIEPLPDFEAALADFETLPTRDGYSEPPDTVSFYGAGAKRGEKVPDSLRTASMYQLPPSHTIVFDAAPTSPLRRGDGAFLVCLAGYLFNARLQFVDWWIDLRVRTAPQAIAWLGPNNADTDDFFATAFQTWRGWQPKTRARFTNLLYLLARADVYQWFWEQFLLTYTCFDACYSTAVDVHTVTAQTRAERLNVMCGRFGLRCDQQRFGAIANHRNELAHEGLFAGSSLGTGDRHEAIQHLHCLRGIVLRLVAALLGWQGGFVQSPWDRLRGSPRLR